MTVENEGNQSIFSTLNILTNLNSNFLYFKYFLTNAKSLFLCNLGSCSKVIDLVWKFGATKVFFAIDFSESLYFLYFSESSRVLPGWYFC